MPLHQGQSRSRTTTSSNISDLCLSAGGKDTLSPSPSVSFQLMWNSVWDFKGNLTYIQTPKVFERCPFASLFPTPKHEPQSKRRAFSCLVFSCNSPRWTPWRVDNLHFDWRAAEVSARLLKGRPRQGKNNTERAFRKCNF